MPSLYRRYYEDFVECDFCGAQTRGRVYRKKPTRVLCGACNRIILDKSAVTLPKMPWKDESDE